jgi:hypothetical protein
MTGSRPIGATRVQSQTRPSNLNGDDALTETPAGASNAVLVDALISVRSFLVEGDCLHWRRCRMGGACRLRLSRRAQPRSSCRKGGTLAASSNAGPRQVGRRRGRSTCCATFHVQLGARLAFVTGVAQRIRSLTPPASGPLNHDQNRLFRSVRRHRSEIMFGVLVVIFCGDCVAVLGFSSREC